MGENAPHRKAPISFGRDKWEKRSLCPREAAGVVCLTYCLAIGCGKSLWLKSQRFACFRRQVQVLSCRISVMEENLAATKPGCQSRGRGFGGGAEKSHKNYLRAGKNACER